MADVHGLDLRDAIGPGPARPGHPIDELLEEECWIAERESDASARFPLEERRSA